MTTLATAAGALPIALGLGAAATSRVPLGIVIVGGLTFSLILTLLIIPAVYTYISPKHHKKSAAEKMKEEPKLQESNLLT
jgi:multidrug efflux pump subunit AcrB